MEKYKWIVHCSGVAYREDTPIEIVNILCSLLGREKRVVIEYGDIYSGGSYYDKLVKGYLSKHTTGWWYGDRIASYRTRVGLEFQFVRIENVIRITYANKKDGGVIYEHPNYKINVPKYLGGTK
jgi:hypothetical protein